jgi:hypothetical protein
MIYLASAYTSSNYDTMDQNFMTAVKAVAYFASYGHQIISPIVAYHQPSVFAHNQDSVVWHNLSENLLLLCNIIYFLKDDRKRWLQSKGMKRELERSIELYKHIYVVEELINKYKMEYLTPLHATLFLEEYYA